MAWIFFPLAQVHHMFLKNLLTTCITFFFSMENVNNLYALLLGYLVQLKNAFDVVTRSWKVMDWSGLIWWYLLEKGSDYLEIFLVYFQQTIWN